MLSIVVFLLFAEKVTSQTYPKSTNNPCDPQLYTHFTGWQDDWVSVPDNQWGYDFVNEVPLAESTSTPCGFKLGQIYEDNNPGFCLGVTGTAETNVQVLIEAEERTQKICIKTPDAGGLNTMATGALDPVCAVGQLRVCFPSESDYFTTGKLNLYIYADPPSAEFNFWYKVDNSIRRDEVPANSSAVNNVDMWCSMIEGTKQTLWPDQCQNLDFETPPPYVAPIYNNNANRFVPSIFFALLFFVF